MPQTTTQPTAPRPGPRERLLATAERLMYERGVDVGVDTILKQAGVARASLYQHFGDKDGLISAVLAGTSEVDLQRYRDALDNGGTEPRERLLSLFDAITATVEREGYRGCRYMSASLALPDPGHPAHVKAHAFKTGIRALIQTELEHMGHPDPAGASLELTILIDGAMSVAITQPDTRPGPKAREMAGRVLDSAAPQSDMSDRPAPLRT